MLRRAFNTSRPLVLDSWVRGQAKCGIKLSPESLAPQQDAAILLPRPAYVNEQPIFDGFLWIFNLQFFAVICKFCHIANRRQKRWQGGSPGNLRSARKGNRMLFFQA